MIIEKYLSQFWNSEEQWQEVESHWHEQNQYEWKCKCRCSGLDGPQNAETQQLNQRE